MNDHDFQVFRIAMTLAVVSLFVALVTVCQPAILAALHCTLWWFQCVGRIMLWISCGAVVLAGRDGGPVARVWFRHYWILSFSLTCLALGMEMQSYSLAVIIIRCLLKLVPVLYLLPPAFAWFAFRGLSQAWKSGHLCPISLSAAFFTAGVYGLLK